MLAGMSLGTDIKRFSRGALPRIAIVTVILLPLLYGAMYLWAFWNPFNEVNKVPVALVNADRGAVVDGVEIDRFPLGTATAVNGGSEGATAIDARPELSAASTWQWQLQGELDVSHDVDVYDVDLFETPPETIERLHADGRTVVCYFSAGSYEGWRPDASGFAATDLGETLDGFADERWLDIRTDTVRAVAAGRIDLAATSGCDGVEPDNVDGYQNDTGFELSADDQLAFNRFLAETAHEHGLLVGLKNDLDQIPELAAEFDFALNEQCHEYDECEVYGPFLDQDKPVFNAEYADRYVSSPDQMCEQARELGLRTLVLPLDLDGSFRIDCDHL